MSFVRTSSLNLNKILNSKFCYVEQFQTGCLSLYSYYIESDKYSVIIDPVRDIKGYLDLLEERKSKLKYIFETHFQADFVSGHVDLSKKTNTNIYMGPTAQANFNLTNLKHEEELEISNNVKIKSLHTPGHTPESTSYLLLEKTEDNSNIYKQLALFTGDTLFLGDTGRPDLASKSDITKEDLAGMLYDSVQYLKKNIEDSCYILPTHGAGSACGKNIQSGSYSTMEQQKKTNWALSNNLKKEEFIKSATTNLPTPPKYFFENVKMNHDNILPFDEVVEKGNKALSVDDIENIIKDNNTKKPEERTAIIEGRDLKYVFEGFIPGSVVISLNTQFAIWSASIFNPKMPVAVIVPEGKEQEALLRLTRTGFDNIIGYLKGGYEAWVKAGKKTDKIEVIKNKDCLNIIKGNEKNILDVRNVPEFVNPGSFKEATRIPLSSLIYNVEDKVINNNENLKNNIYALCKAGTRATMASTVLRAFGYKGDIKVLEGGIDNLIKEGAILDYKESSN